MYFGKKILAEISFVIEKHKRTLALEGGNQLMAVNDAMDTPAATKSDFKDNGSKGTVENPEYEYDANGNMIWDGNKGITVTYNHLNLPERVDFGDGRYIEYTYDAAGTKLRQEVHDGQNPVKRTDYVGGMVYEDGQLQFIQHEEGRIVMVDNDGLSKLPEYQYHLKDHLGNVRLTFSAEPETESSTATLETAHEEEEYATFLRYDETTKVNSTLFDHTNNGDTHYAVRLNGTANERRGLAKSLAVMTGDTVRAEVFAKYLDPDPDNWTAALQGLMAAIAAGTAPAGTVIEAVPASGDDGFPFAGLLDAAKAGDTGTRAYLNILLFDEGLRFLDAAYVPVSMAAKEDGTNVPHERLNQEIVVQQPGYAYIYFSNDNEEPLEVFFDDFTVEHVHSAIVQADDYYPFGLTFNSYKRENSVANKYLYNGKELQEELDLGWYAYGARNYDPSIGRFFNIDRFAEKYYDFTPYQYGANSPINFIDINGDSLWIQINNNNKALYVDGNLYNSDGTEYSGKGVKTDKNGNTKLTGFLKSTVDDLNQISSGKEGNKLVDELQAAPDHVTIKSGMSGNSYNTKTNEVEFNTSSQNGGLNTQGSNSRPTYVGLAHELFHGVDDIRGTVSGRKVGTTNQAEIFASHGENLIRAENFLPLRTQYNSGTPIIDAFGNSIYFGNNYYNDMKLKPVRNLVPASTVPTISIKIQKR